MDTALACSREGLPAVSHQHWSCSPLQHLNKPVKAEVEVMVEVSRPQMSVWGGSKGLLYTPLLHLCNMSFSIVLWAVEHSTQIAHTEHQSPMA